MKQFGAMRHHNEKVTVRFSEVHWYEVTLPWVDVEAAYGRDIAGLAGLTDAAGEIPEDVNDLLDGAMSDQSARLAEVDGREIHGVRRAEGGGQS